MKKWSVLTALFFVGGCDQITVQVKDDPRRDRVGYFSVVPAGAPQPIVRGVQAWAWRLNTETGALDFCTYIGDANPKVSCER